MTFSSTSSPFFHFFKIYLLKKWPCDLEFPHDLYFTDCRLMVQFSMFLCPLDIDTWIQRFEQTQV